MSSVNGSAWRCSVCGYIHRGAQRPTECPVCGSPGEHFEAYREAPAAAAPAPRQWRCLVCAYVHTGAAAPETCPVCGTPARQFEPFAAQAGQPVVGARLRVLIVGGGVAGVEAAAAIRKAAAKAEICVLTREEQPPYFRLNLTRLLAGQVAEASLPLRPPAWYPENGIDLRLGATVSGIDLERREVTLSGASPVAFDRLILTTGAHPFVPPVGGMQLENVIALRSLQDVALIRRALRHARSVVVVGGGILGLEAAAALVGAVRRVTAIETYAWLMPRQLNRQAAERLQAHVTRMGIGVRTGQGVKELVGDEAVAGVVLENGDTLPADLVIVTAGVRPNSYLARLAGLQVNQGIVVDNYMQASAPGVYAAGDAVEYRGELQGLWSTARYQGRIAGLNAVGGQVEYGGIPRANTLKVLDVDLFSIGRFEAVDGSYTVIENETEAVYLRFVFRDTYLVGAILYGDTAISPAVKRAIEDRHDFSDQLRRRASAAELWTYFTGR